MFHLIKTNAPFFYTKLYKKIGFMIYANEKPNAHTPVRGYDEI